MKHFDIHHLILSRCPQYLYLTDKVGNRIVTDANIVHFENLLEEFESLMKRYNCPYTLKGAKKMMASVNSTSAAEATSNGTVKKKFTVADLSKECVDLIQQVYAQDFQYFHYKVDPMHCCDIPRSPSSLPLPGAVHDAAVQTNINASPTSRESNSSTTAISSDLPSTNKKRPYAEVDVVPAHSWLLPQNAILALSCLWSGITYRYQAPY